MAYQGSLFGSDERAGQKKHQDALPPPSTQGTVNEPLAARMRPRTLDEIVGQEHLLAPGKLLRRTIENDKVTSMILWGPPGSGKTTLAEVIAHQTHAQFVRLNAVSAGVADLRR